MIIIHCLKQSTWDQYKDKTHYGEQSLQRCGFIHCSEVLTYAQVAPNFKDEVQPLVLLVIDPARVQPEIKWEDLDGTGTAYPHIYGLLNTDAVVEVLPHLWDKQRNWVVNPQLLNQG